MLPICPTARISTRMWLWEAMSARMVCFQTYTRRVFINSSMNVLLLINSCKLQMRTSASRFDMERNSQQSQQKDGAEPEASRGEAPPTGAGGMNPSTNRSSVGAGWIAGGGVWLPRWSILDAWDCQLLERGCHYSSFELSDWPLCFRF